MTSETIDIGIDPNGSQTLSALLRTYLPLAQQQSADNKLGLILG